MSFQKLILSPMLYLRLTSFVLLLAVPLHICADNVLFSEATRLMSEKNWSAAEKKLLALQKKSPNNIAILNNLGITYYHLKKPKVSRQYFIKAIESVPGAKVAFRNILQLNQAQQGKTKVYFKSLALESVQSSKTLAITSQASPQFAEKSTTTNKSFRAAAEQLKNRPMVLNLQELDSQDPLLEGMNDNDPDNGYLAEIDREIDSAIDFSTQSDLVDSDAAADSYLQDLFSKDTIVLDQVAPATISGSPASQADQKIIKQRLNDWSKAWSSGDVDNYLSFYSRNYSSSNRSRTSWIRDRRKKVTVEKQIQVSISKINIRQISNPNRLVTRFRQKYQAKSYRDNSRKELYWQKQNGKWLIVKERSL